VLAMARSASDCCQLCHPPFEPPCTGTHEHDHAAGIGASMYASHSCGVHRVARVPSSAIAADIAETRPDP
jgi:hypothetical protein